MSKRKAKQEPPFKEWPIEQVMATAQMLFASNEQIRNVAGLVTASGEKSIKLPWDEARRWRFLARLAYEFLDHLSHACETLAREERNAASAYARFKERGAGVAQTIQEAAQLPELVPFEQALRFITRQQRTAGARTKFEKLWCAIPDYPPKGILTQWEKTGSIPRDDVRVLRFTCDKMSSRIKAEQNRANARKGKREKKGPPKKQRAQFVTELSDKLGASKLDVLRELMDKNKELEQREKPKSARKGKPPKPN